jgi:hypothetical protein
VFTGGTHRGGAELAALVVVGVFIEFVFAAQDADKTGGVDDPSLEGIEIDDKEDVDETGDGIAVTPLLATALIVAGASKFDIVGECFLLLKVPLFAPRDCFEFGDDKEVDVLVHVVGTLFATVTVAAADFPFVSDAVVLGC